MSDSAGSPTQRAKTSPKPGTSIHMARRCKSRSSSSTSPAMGSSTKASVMRASSGFNRTQRALAA
eukprot:CAMPEP_0180714170 /NCGR_PEP_ID=MMETSP1038_2-20121128/12283_1 /TAXON_ID=632150 /ORGANISM="Azadinium spinosum, Strain 3D9" /LENGTH=64 /DNA_ID=CAMNT_0022746525 /DNA_START=90 /DNA_END=284 /DNA_ORIENTATION=-